MMDGNAFPLDPVAWDRRTAHLSPTAATFYLRLLLWSWDQGRALPVDARAQATIARCIDRALWAEAWAELQGFFQPAQGGGLVDPWMLLLRQQLTEATDAEASLRAQRTAAGKASAAKRGGLFGRLFERPAERDVERDAERNDPLVSGPVRTEPEREAQRRDVREAEDWWARELAPPVAPSFERDAQRPVERNDPFAGRPVRIQPGSDETELLEERALPETKSSTERAEERRAVDQKQSARADEFSTGDLMPDPDRALLKLAHTVLDELPGGKFDAIDAMEALKRKAAVARVPYDSTRARKVLDRALAQQSNLGPSEVATRLVIDVLERNAGVPMPMDDMRAEVWSLFQNRYPNATEEQRDDIMSRAWSRRLLEAQPDHFTIQGKELDRVVLTRRLRR